MKRLNIIILVLLFSLTACQSKKSLCETNAEIPITECEALIKIFNETDGSNWLDKRGWVENNLPCSWYGIVCSNGNVISISLNVNNLRGVLPEEIGNFSRLKKLVMYFNHLSGEIPETLENTQLEVLILHNNELSGGIPISLSKLVGLIKIDLENNNLSGSIPSEFGNLSNLEVLNLRANNINGHLPSEISQLTKLTGLLLSNNPITGKVPEEYNKLTNLRMFSIYGTEIEGPLPINLKDLVESGYDWFLKRNEDGD